MTTFHELGKNMRRFSFLFLGLISICLLNACLSYDLSRRVVEQGNLLPDQKIERLKVGMSKEDAAILMGTSLLSPMFQKERWDYANSLQVNGNPLKVRRVVLYFNGNTLQHIEHNP
ncbi:MAG: outer membrane protein assembly factor BamE [Legionellaceae bacterium]|nr:outer membrane protein assembly factor BamE [Legionellaceae bacterium]